MSCASSRFSFWSNSITFLEYIQSQVVGSYSTTGENSSWIELPYTTMLNDRVEIKWQYLSLPPNNASYGIIFGGGDKKYGSWRTLAVGVKNYGAAIYNNDAGGLGTFTSVGSVSTIITSTGNAIQEQDPTYPMTLFIQNENASNTPGEFHGYAHQITARCWYCRIYRSNNLIFDLQPVKIGKNIGMLNKVDNNFYTSKCDVQFIAGPILVDNMNQGLALILPVIDKDNWKEAA